MYDFFNKDDLIIIVDDEIIPNNKENFKLIDLQDNMVTLIAKKLDLTIDEYENYSLLDIENLLEEQNSSLEDLINYEIPEEFKLANLVKYNPFDISESTIIDKIMEVNAKRNFIVLDKFLEKNENMNIIKNYLTKLSEIILEYYIGIVFYSSDPNVIESLEDSKLFLEKIGLGHNEIENLSMHVNFVDKGSKDKLLCFEKAFRKSQNSNLLSLYSESYDKTIQELKERMWDINNNESLIHYDYLIEGMQIDDIFYEIYKSRFNKIYSEKCFEEYGKYINPVRKSIQIYEGNKNLEEEEIKRRVFISRSVKELNNLLNKESYLSECKKSDDIKFGDLIKIEDSHYMVITQDCDLSIRLLGGRKSNFITLIKINYSIDDFTNNLISKKIKYIFNQTFGDTKSGYNIVDIIKSDITSFKKLNISESMIDNIFINKEKDKCDIKCKNENIELDPNINLYTVDNLFIDCILINFNNSDAMNVTIENINNSKEIRLATKKNIINNFNNFIDRYSKLQYDSLKEISDNNLISDLIPIEFIFDKGKKLTGFSIGQNKIKRVAHIEYIKAYDLFKEFLGKYSRLSFNSPPLI